MARKGDPRTDWIREYAEWAEHRYDPGHYLGGTLEPHLRKYALGSRARKRAGHFLAVGAILAFAAVGASWRTQETLENVASVSFAVLTSAAAWKMYRG
jgi:hypothetical protein